MAGKKLLNRMEISKNVDEKHQETEKRFPNQFGKGRSWVGFTVQWSKEFFFLFRSSPLIQPPPRFFSILKSQRMMSGVSALASACPFHTKKHLSPLQV
jgi:hypothetical protein